MYIKIINPLIHGNTTYTNTGSCLRIINYLSKENSKVTIDERELFFNHEGRDFSGSIVRSDIDNNVKGISKDRPKFHSIVIAPDQNELSFLKYNTEKLKDYTNEVMKQYVSNFSTKDKSILTINDLVWYGKLEYERNGDSKGGDNIHIHIIVSARDKNQRISLSPNTNDKRRFNRVKFYLNSERQFDRIFGYKRTESLLLTDQIKKRGSLDLKDDYFSKLEKLKAKQIKSSEEADVKFKPILESTFIPLLENNYHSQPEDDIQDEIEKRKKKKKRNNDMER